MAQTVNAVALLHGLYKSMNFPNVSLEDSMACSEGKHMLANATFYLMGGTETQRMREAGIPTPNYPSSVRE